MGSKPSQPKVILKKVWVPYNPRPPEYYNYPYAADPLYQQDGYQSDSDEDQSKPPGEKPTEEPGPPSKEPVKVTQPEPSDPRASVDFFDDDEDEDDDGTPPKDPPAEQRQRRRLALLFGNDNYAPPQTLSCCRKSAQDMEEKLKSLDFDCTVVLDGRRRTMMSKEKAFREKIRQGDCILVYFSGYGVDTKGKDYVVPIYRPEDKIEPEYDFIGVEDMIKRLNEKRDLLTIVILDACRVDDTHSTFRSSAFPSGRDAPPFGGASSNRMDIPEETKCFLAYSCDPGKTSPPGENSRFTAALLENITRPEIDITSMMKDASKQVRQATRGKQRPRCLSYLSENFCFTMKTKTEAAV